MPRSTSAPCGFLLEQLSAFLDADLSAAECRRIRRHSRTCARCAAAIADLRAAIGACHEAADTPLPAAIRRRAEARVRELMAGRQPASRRRLKR